MPKYNVKGKSYTIPQMMQEKFESDMPDASVQMYDKDGKSYTIPIAMQNAFKRDHEGWSYDAPQVSPSNNSSPKPMDERGYVFNESELMGESTENKDNTPARTLKGIVDAQKPKTMADVDWSKVNANIDFSTEKNPYPQYTGEDVAKNFEKQRIAQQNQEEDSKVDKQYTPKEENTAMDVYDNYMNRFALTKEGSALQKELADIEGEVQDKYIEEFKTSDAYKNIMALYDGSEDSKERVSTLLNETFVKEYGERINNDIAPYRKAYIDEMQTRYGDRFNESIKGVARKENASTVSKLMDEIDTISQNLNEYYGVDDKHFFQRKRFAMGDNDRQTLRQAKELLEDSRNVIEEATKHKDSGFISGVVRGVRDNLSPEDFTFGISDLVDEKRLNNILGRYEKGEKVSDAEMKLLEASAANMVTHAYYDMMLSSGYKAGQVTAESLPFMLEFVANPIAGSGKALAKGLLKVALKKFGSKAINAGTKFGARLLGDALAAGGMTLTSGLAGVEAEATRRMNEGYDYGMRDGKLYVERKPDAISWGEARGKAFAQRAIENQSEMVFNAFSGVGKVLGGKGSILSKLSESKGGKFIKDAFNNKYIKEIAESTQFHGLPVEYMEEVYNNGANVLLGEMSVEDFADVDKNVETFLGLAPTSVVFGLLGLGGMAIDKVSNRRELNRIYNSLPDDLREQYNRVMQSKGYNAESTKEFVKSVITNPRATEEEKAAAIRLGYCTVADMTYEDAEQAEQSGDVPVTPSVKQEGDNAYENAQVTTTEEVQQVGTNARQAVVELSSIEGGEGVKKSIDNFLSNETISEEEVNEFFNSLPAEQQKSAKAYYTTQRALQGAHDAFVKSANNDVDAYEASVAPFVTENENGTRQVTMAQYEGGEWFVTSNDGEHSVLKNTKGEERMVLSKDLEGVNTLNIDDVIERKRTEAVQAAESGFEFTTSHHQKTQMPSVGMPLMNGNETFVVVGVDGDVVNVVPAKVNKEGQLEPKGVSPSQMSVSEVLKMQDDFYQASEVAQQIGGSVSEEELKDDVNGLNQENQSGGGNAVDMSAPEMNVEHIQPIPTVKRGNKTVTMYHQVPVSRTMADLHDGTMDTQEVNDFIEANISEAQRDLEKAREKKPTMTTDKASYVQSKQAWQAEIDDAQKKLDYWNSVKEEEQRITSNVVLGQNQQVKIVPTTPEEYVANAFGDGGLKITPESYRKETGYGVEEQRKMVGVIASAENGGISIERASEIIYESGVLEEIGFLGDQTDVRDLIIKVLSDGNPRGYMKRRAEDRALSESEMYDLGNWTMENFGMTAEEYLAYEENFLPGMIEKYGGFEEESFYANLAEYYEYKDNYESRREDKSVAGGSEVLQGEQSVPSTGGGSVDVGGQTSSVPVGVQSGVADATPQIEEVESSTGLSEEEAAVLITQMESTAELANDLELNPENWESEFGESGILETPIGPVKMGENQYLKLLKKKRSKYFGMIRPTLTNPDIVLEEYDPKEGAERETKYLFVKTFIKADGSRYVHFESVTVKKETFEVSISSHEINEEPLKRKMQQCKLLHLNDKFLNSEIRLTEPQEGSDLVPTPNLISSESKDSVTDVESQENIEKIDTSSKENATQQPTGIIDILEEAAVIAEENRRKPLRERVAEWANKLGIDMVVLENLDEVTNSQARKAIESGDGRYPGWYGEKSGKVYIYLPHVTDVKDIDETVVHEVVAHKGLRRLMGEKFDALCDMVWNSMSKENREKFMSYPGVNGNHRAAADEYMAYIAEKTELTEEERGIWDKIVQFVKDLITLNLGVKLSDAQIAGLIRASYAEMKREAGKQKEAETTDTTPTEGTRFSKKKGYGVKDVNARNFGMTEKHAKRVTDEAMSIVTGKSIAESRSERIADETERKELAAEIYESVLSGEFNDVTLQLIDNYITDVTPQNPYGKRISQRVPQAVERTVYGGKRTSAVDLLFSRISESAVPASERASKEGRRRIEEKKKELLKGWAIATGNWHTDLSAFVADESPFDYGKDSDVYYSKQEGFVIKTSKGKPIEKGFPVDLDNIPLFNYYFPNTAYDILGYGEIDGNFVRILSQPMVHFADDASVSVDERVEYMDKLGFRPLNKENTAFTNDDFVVADLQKANIVRDSKGDLRVIDADMKLHTTDVGGNYDYPPVEDDIHFRRVYHGSGAEFDMFDHSHMGEGEGNQAFGWGTYVTDVEGIGRQYGRATSKPRLSFKGSIVDSEDFYNPWRIIMDLYNDHYGRLRDMRNAAERYSGLVEDDNVKLKELWENVIHTLGNVRSGDLKIVPGRYLYTVEIPDDNGSNYLHWDEDVSKKLENTVKERLFNILAEGQGQAYKEDLKQELDDVFKFYNYTIPSLYNNVSAYVGGAKAASQFFADMGYVGISYPAEAMSGGRADGARNFVIFNEADAKIEDRVMFRKVGDNMEHTVMFRSSPLFKGLRELEDGETCDVERIFTENKYFEFSGVNKIKSYSDVAYIFKQLEDESVENAFAVLVKRGKPTVIHLGMGHYTQTMVNKSVLNVAVTRMNPDKIYFVHNHPSGQLKASAQDVRMLQSLQEAYGSKMADGIIINTRSGQYGVFNEESYTTKVDAQTGLSDTSEAKPLKVYTFSKQVFSKDYQPGRSLLSSEDVARFVSSHRLGDRKKLGLIISNNNGITGNIFLPYTDINKDNAQSIASDIIYYTSVMGGTHAVMFGNTPVRDMAHEGIGMLVEEFSGLRLLDYLKIDGGRYYSASDEGLRFRVANRNQVGFVSNAMKAVEGIKQEKATPQQWLAMIEKQGGLKAGEDKWLGLSDWLKSSDKKTLTKDEVLDFIGENMIRIEEVKYGEGMPKHAQEKLDELNAEFNEQIYLGEEETDSIYTSDWVDYAWSAMVDRYGDDFESAFRIEGGGTNAELVPMLEYDDEMTDQAKYFLEINDSTNKSINSTRLDYTTEGLENKREIALTVPTIESWNEYDDIHFGDAGDGRAVAWIRFGEATTYENVDDVQQVTDFHEPYKDVNGLDIYKPIGSFRNGDFIAHGKGRNGDMIYVVYINGNQVPVSYKTLDDARVGMNEYYKEHPRKLRKPLKVLVIDEIQSKRHQEGREKGYKNDSESLKIETAEEDLRKATKAFNDYRDELRVKYDYDHLEGSIIARTRAFMDGMTEAERTEFKRLAELKADATRVLEATRSGHISMDDVEFTEHDGLIEGRYGDFVSRYTSDTPRSAVLADLNNQIREHRISESRKLVPSAPFEKNWHELAMKRMLRLAAEEGFDKVAWTTGAQQAERYNIGTMVRDIEVLPVTDAETGEVLDAEFDVYTHSNSGNYISEATGRMKTEQIMEVFGKDLGGRIIEGGRTQSHTVISGKGLNIGGEGMKGFYDRMLPSFVNKYTKKWGTKVGEVELPELEESAQKMWSVDVTEQMKAEVEEQVMFSRKPVGGNSGYTTRTDGTAISLRAEEAESDGTFTAGTFCKIYGVSRSSFNLLRELGIIKNTEWHHTGQSFKKNDFFSWGDSERAVTHGGVDYSGGEVVDGSFADIYMQNKKEIDGLAKDYENKDWEYRREERLHPIPKIADYLYDDFNETWEGLLTEGENRARLAEHEVISNGGFELGTSWERKNMHEKVDDHYKNVARERYDEDAVRRQYEAQYSASIVENKEKEGRNATLKEDNLSTDGKESSLLDILGFFESNADKAYDKVAGISSYAIGKIELNKKEELRKSIRAKYDEMIDGVRTKRQKWVDKKLKEGSIEKKERISSRPEFFVTEREEMNGKFGWFDATSRYNLPIYYTGIDMKTARNMKHYNGYDQEILELEKRYNEEVDEQLMFRKVSEQIEDMFDSAISGDLKGKPISIGKLTVEGKEYLELISGLTLKNDVDFVLNPSDLVHIYNDHYGTNEKDKGNNIPLTKHDIKRMVDVVAFPSKIIYGTEPTSGRNLFYFLMDSLNGTYNLLEVYANKKGNLTAKTYYKTKKDATQRVMELSKTLLPTSETYSGAILSKAKVPQMFESASVEEEKVLFRVDEEHVNPLENETVRAWDKLASSRAFLYRETAVDYLTAVREFQDLVAKRNHIKVADYENAYDALLALSSRNRTEMDAFDSMVFRPLQAAIRRLVGKKKWMQKWDWSKGELRALDVYAKTKHGIERNRDMAVRSAIATSGVSKSAQSNAISEWERRSREIMDQPLTWNEKRMMLDALALTFGADLKADYSGLSKIKELQGEKENDWVQNAVTFVNEYETNHDKGAVENLWFAIRQMTTFSLEKQRKSGLVSGEYMNRQLARYEYYVPLRGWAEDIAEDVYGYADDNVKSKGSTPVKTAHGRTSEAGNPFGAMVEVAYKSISAGNKNLAKQKLYHLVDNNDTGDLVRVNKSWMIRYEDLKDYDWLTFQELGEDEEMPEWVEVRPISFDTPYGATADERAEIEAKRSQRLAEFEELMTQLQSEGKARPITHKSKLEYRPLNKQQRQHETDVYIGGNKYTLTIVGNPRLMQAVNGLLNPNTSENWVAQKAQVVKQFMAGNFTSRNPAFSLANLFKDAAYGNNQAFIKEGWKYWARFTKNQDLILGGMGRMMKYMSLYHGGSWQPKNKAEELFKEFMDNGGATGYTFIETQQEYATEISDSLGKLTDNGAEKLTAQRGVKLIFDGIEYIGQAAELATRYAAYRTSREMGRSVSKSIIDAKEITVNFNRKGAGTKTTEFLPDGPSDLALLSSVSQFGRDYILFWNAGVQSKYRTFENFKEHPIRTSASMVTPLIFMGGVGLPLLNNVVLPALYEMLGWGSDDDEDYWDLPEHIRQNRLCLRLPKGMGWFTIPLNPEFVTFLRFGDILGAHTSGVRPFEATDVLKLGMDLSFPIGINDESTVTAINSVFPSVVQPVFQHMTNTNFYGGKLYKEGFGKYAAYDPEYKKAYSSTSPTMIEVSRMMNRLAGGNDIVRGKGPLANINPGIMYNYLSGTLGGYATTFLSVTDAMLSYANGDSFEVASNKLPLVGRFFASGDKDMKAKRLRGQYINTVETFMNKVRHDELGYDKAFSEGKIDVDEWRKFYESEDYKKYVNMKEYVETVKAFSKSVEENPDNESGEALLYESQLEALKFFREWDKKD